MKDSLDRVIDYMRVSVTDRCNLRCKYCMPESLPFIPHENILRYEEILRLCGIAAKLGIRNVKVTGGEPLVRKGCVDFIRDLKALPGIERVTLTTNGLLLAPLVDKLAEIGLDGVNVSLDSLNPDIYRQITGQDAFSAVWSAILQSAEANLRVKINCVPLKELNGGEIPSIARIAEKLPVDVRFIELMPTGSGKKFDRVTGGEILERLTGIYPDLASDRTRRGSGPARYFTSARLLGGIGLIDAVSHYFCADCNRVRLTSEGFFKLCLYHDNGLDLRPLLRGRRSDSEIEALMGQAIKSKPERHAFAEHTPQSGIRTMAKIGG